MEKPSDCKHNKAVECQNRTACSRCGWHPTEEKRRANYIKKHRTNAGMLNTKQKEITTETEERSKPDPIGAIKAVNLRSGETVCYESVAAACEGSSTFRKDGIYRTLSGSWTQYKGWKFERVEDT